MGISLSGARLKADIIERLSGKPVVVGGHDIHKMTVRQLTDYAKANGISLSGVHKKVDIIARINLPSLVPNLVPSLVPSSMTVAQLKDEAARRGI